MDQFFHVRILIAIIFGLSLTHLLKGLVKFIEHPTREKSYWVHLLWVFFFFLLSIHFWWWEFALAGVRDWNFITYFIVILYTTLFYINSSLLFPDSMEDYVDYRDYYFKRRKWFFGLLAIMFILDIFDTELKGPGYLAYLGMEYQISVGIQILFCLFAIFIKNTKFHAILAILFILYRIAWIYWSYFWLSPN